MGYVQSAGGSVAATILTTGTYYFVLDNSKGPTWDTQVKLYVEATSPWRGAADRRLTARRVVGRV